MNLRLLATKTWKTHLEVVSGSYSPYSKTSKDLYCRSTLDDNMRFVFAESFSVAAQRATREAEKGLL
ncbi:hypothetical protein KQX54_006652 [Cotesia glomerata]|uniref:Uncharacterized protein n=1 Tax=Cotesia glomerata TaxID=32391 RepID=A0AAV7HXB1_COTGL|nr:hypothetical protein KQX54_006652 [Cotesia glomerata]